MRHFGIYGVGSRLSVFQEHVGIMKDGSLAARKARTKDRSVHEGSGILTVARDCIVSGELIGFSQQHF